MGGTFVECVRCTVCSLSVPVRCFLCQPLILFCSTSPKYEKESENLSPCSLLTFHVFVQLSQLVAMHHLPFCIVTKVPGRCPHSFSPKEEPLPSAPTLWTYWGTATHHGYGSWIMSVQHARHCHHLNITVFSFDRFSLRTCLQHCDSAGLGPVQWCQLTLHTPFLNFPLPSRTCCRDKHVLQYCNHAATDFNGSATLANQETYHRTFLLCACFQQGCHLHT